MSDRSWFPWVRRRRDRIRNIPVSPEQLAILDENAPFVRDLDAGEVGVLHGLIQLFLHDKTFEGCGGLEMTDEIRVTIAAHASLLLLSLDVEYPYTGLDVIRVYPHTYRASTSDRIGDVVVQGHVSHRLGESSMRGFIVLSWHSVLKGARRPDGQNVVLHEFAHQLDTQDGSADGAPILPRQLYGPWARVLGEAFEELQEDTAARRRSVLDGYGATNPAEFFAVATETFFEQPEHLKGAEPELYDVLATYYRQDPAGRA